ncbi:MAG: alpha/beta fold hydrolase, partial [Myxococcales bacterium]|nr:alpha/beta fold hydrolase [Myxococcales bacterium]
MATMAAECATMTVPLVHGEPSVHGEPTEPRPATLDVALMRVRARQPSGRQLWYLAGGPGGAGTSLLPLLHRRYGAAWQGADFYAIDHRGTGGSHRLSCPAQEAPGSPGDGLLAPAEVDPCIESLRRDHGDVLPHLTVTASVHDLAAALEVTRGRSRVLLWGNSFGTYWAQRFVERYPEAVDGVFLEALVPVGYSYRAFDHGMNDAGRRLLQRCADEPACRERFGADPVALAEGLPARLHAGHCEALALPVPASWV